MPNVSLECSCETSSHYFDPEYPDLAHLLSRICCYLGPSLGERSLIRNSMRREFIRLRQKARSSLLEVQRSLSLGLYEFIYRWVMIDLRDIMEELMPLWQDLQTFLLQLQKVFLQLENVFLLCGMVLLYLLLSSSFSEFPNHLRPPCTTMPWTIWPALIVLWGVCWMFYEPLNFDWEAQLFESEISGSQIQGLGSVLPNFEWGGYEWDTPHPNLLDLGQQTQCATPGSGTIFCTPLVGTPGITRAIVAPTSIIPCQATSTAQEASEEQQLEVAESTFFAAPDVLSLVHGQPLDVTGSSTMDNYETKPSRNSKHGQTESYHCPYPDCSRSQQGSGFLRKDHLDQHLRGPHKQSSVSRVRHKSGVVRSLLDPTATSQITGDPSQSKKRKRGHEDSEAHSADELAEERRLRLLAEQELKQLRQKLERYEERMEKYEERIDRIMNLFREHRGRGDK